MLSLAACGAAPETVASPDPAPRVVTASVELVALGPSPVDFTAPARARRFATPTASGETGVDAGTCAADGGPPEIGDDADGTGPPTVAFGCSCVGTYGDLDVPAGASVRLAPDLHGAR